MAKSLPKRIDAWGHVLPPKYREALYKFLPSDNWWVVATKPNKGFDMDNLLTGMDKFEDQAMVLTLACPPIELIADPKKAVEFARLANDGMAEMVAKYPNKFITAIASLPMNNIDAALDEVDRAIKDLKFRGIQMFSPVVEKPIDSPEFLPLYEKMEKYDLPIYLHPARLWLPEYKGEAQSKYSIWLTFGWLFESASAMTRLICSGVMEKYPNLKIVVHHTGSIVPFLESRLIEGESPDEARKHTWAPVYVPKLTKSRLEYYKRFYTDTEIRTVPALMCTYNFLGPEHVMFGVGIPHGFGTVRSIEWTMESIQKMPIGEKERQMIYRENAIKLLHLTN